MLSQIVYISTSEIDDFESEVDNILATSRSNNKEAEVTGVLLHAQGMFFQVLEGDPAQLKPVLDRISKDKRHSGVTVLLEREVTKRHFSEWEMGWSRIPDSHPASERIAKLGKAETYAGKGKDSEVDSLIQSFFELNLA